MKKNFQLSLSDKNAEKHKDFNFFMSDTKACKVIINILLLGKITKGYWLEIS